VQAYACINQYSGVIYMKRKNLVFGLVIFLILFAITPLFADDLNGIWTAKLATNETMEIRINGADYSIIINGFDNNNGIVIIGQRYGSSSIIFNIKQYINANNKWKKTNAKMRYFYRMENGQMILSGGPYSGTYTRQGS